MEPLKLKVRRWWYSGYYGFECRRSQENQCGSTWDRHSGEKLAAGAKPFWGFRSPWTHVDIGETSHHAYPIRAHKLLTTSRVLKCGEPRGSRPKFKCGASSCLHRRWAGCDLGNRRKWRWRRWVCWRSGLLRRHGLWVAKDGIFPPR